MCTAGLENIVQIVNISNICIRLFLTVCFVADSVCIPGQTQHMHVLFRARQPYLLFDCCSHHTACLYRWCALECGIMQCYALCAGCVRCCCRTCSPPCTPRGLEQPSGTPFTTTKFAGLSQVSLPTAHVPCLVCSRLAIGCLRKDQCAPSHLFRSLLHVCCHEESYCWHVGDMLS